MGHKRDRSKRASRNESRKQDKLDAERRIIEQMRKRKDEAGVDLIPDNRPKDLMDIDVVELLKEPPTASGRFKGRLSPRANGFRKTDSGFSI